MLHPLQGATAYLFFSADIGVDSLNTPAAQQSDDNKEDSLFQTYRVVVSTRARGTANDRSGYVRSAHQIGITNLESCTSMRLYFLQGSLTPNDVELVASELLADPVTETYRHIKIGTDTSGLDENIDGLHIIEVTLLPGVTDPAAENLIHAATLLGINGLRLAATAHRYELTGELSSDDLRRLTTDVLSNQVIQRHTIDQLIDPPFFSVYVTNRTVDQVLLQDADDDGLMRINAERRLALDMREMQAIQTYYRREQREPTDVELEMLAQTWSEHCIHKTFKAIIDCVHANGDGATTPTESIDGLLRSYIRAATEKINKPWVRSAFVDNAGIVAFDDSWDLAFKVETHNHPSALEPFGGANTGVGGVIRDILGVSARPIANTDVLCFGPLDMSAEDVPQGVLHPRRIADGVIHGVEDYGNKMGIPTVNGAILYHAGYTANPLVFCGCLGILPHGSHPSTPRTGDLIVVIGGRTGRDGLRGATFSSMEMDHATGDIAGTAVQIGHPIHEKQAMEALLKARDAHLYSAVTDCGAGGLSSAVGELAKDLGATVQLVNVPLKYSGLRPWEIWLSEAQERMVLAVPPANWPRLQEICDGFSIEAVSIGQFEDSGRLHLYYADTKVADLDMHFLHNGIPRRQLTAWVDDHLSESDQKPQPITEMHSVRDLGETLLKLLAHPDIRSKESVVRLYDHEVQGGTVVKPMTGTDNHGPGDAVVLVPQPYLDDYTSRGEHQPLKGVALSNGICPSYSERDSYAMAWAAIDEAMRNAVAVGADPDQVSLLDNFCWGNPNLPDRLGSLVRCVQGCYDAALAYNAPFISGKDSLNNEYTTGDGFKHAIPGTLLISAMAIVPNIEHAVTMDLKQAGNVLYAIGVTRDETGGSHLHLVNPNAKSESPVPQPVRDSLSHMRRLHRAISLGLVRSCHDCSEGGLAVALAEMCLAGHLGVSADITKAPGANALTLETALFSESSGRFIVEVKEADRQAFEDCLGDTPHAVFGYVVDSDTFKVSQSTQEPVLNLTINQLDEAWREYVAPTVASVPRLTVPAANVKRTAPMMLKKPRVLIMHATGTNRDHDAALACACAGGEPVIVHVNQLLAGDQHLRDFAMVVLPGGFSYGDDLGAGTLWSLDLHRKLSDDLSCFISDGRPVLGICNGFQALVKAGLLPGQMSNDIRQDGVSRTVTLAPNEEGRFECRWVYLKPESRSPCIFTAGMSDMIYCPVAHGEGRVTASDMQAIDALHKQGLIALTYVDEYGAAASYPGNPNGSTHAIAGLTNRAGNILGLMPHPENHIFGWQHPRHTRGEKGMQGLWLFENGIKYTK